MQRKILTLLLVGLSGFVFTAPAGAAAAPHRYSPRHGSHCRATYKRVVRHRRHHRTKVFCVKRATRKHRKATPTVAPVAPTSAPAAQLVAPEKAKLHAHLDPEYTQNPLNPFEVTYAYSASATQDVAGSAAHTAAIEEPAPLPSGVLSLYSDGMLECAINVGSGVEGSECPVTYKRLGEHRVTTIYTSGEESATETEVENIEPLPVEISLAARYEEIWEGAGLVSITATTNPPIQSASLRISIPAEGGGSYWQSGSVTSGQAIQIYAYCEGDEMWIGVPHQAYQREPSSFFEGRALIAEFTAPGYLPSTGEVPLPAFTSCYENT